MDQGIRSAAFKQLENRFYTRLLSKAPDPNAGKIAPLPENKMPTVGITLSIGTTPKPDPYSDEPKRLEGWRSKPLPAVLLANAKKQIIESGKDAAVLSEKPDSEDPTRLALTEQANQFLLGEGDNPFSGLTREALSSISHDDTGTYTTSEIAAAMQEMSDNDGKFWEETYKRISDAEIKNGNNDDTQPMMLKAQLKLLTGMSEAEKVTLDYTASSLTIELADWETAGYKTPDAVDYSELEEPEARALAATTDKDGKAIWKQYSVRLLSAETTKLSLLNGMTSENAAQTAGSATVKGEWLQVYAQIDKF